MKNNTTQEWIDGFRGFLLAHKLPLLRVIRETPGLRVSHYPQVWRFLKKGAGLSPAKRAALMETAERLAAAQHPPSADAS